MAPSKVLIPRDRLLQTQSTAAPGDQRDEDTAAFALFPGSMADARRGFCRFLGQRRNHALLCGVSRGVHRRIPLEPGRDLNRVFGVSTRRRRHLATRRYDGRQVGATSPLAARGKPALCRAVGEGADLRPLAEHPVVRNRHDHRGQLPWARRIRAPAVAPFRAASRDGDLDRPVGQWLWPRRLGAARTVSDLDNRLAPDVFGAGGVYRRCSTIARGRLPPSQPLPDRARSRRRGHLGFGSPSPALPQLDLGRSSAHAAFLAALRGLFVYRRRQLSGVIASARLCDRCRLRQALRSGRARHRQLSCDRRHDRHRHIVGLYRARVVGNPGLWRLDRRSGVRSC